MEKSKEVTITLGALASPLDQQLKGILPLARLKFYECKANALVLLHVHGIITDGEIPKGRKRLVKALMREIRENQKYKEPFKK